MGDIPDGPEPIAHGINAPMPASLMLPGPEVRTVMCGKPH